MLGDFAKSWRQGLLIVGIPLLFLIVPLFLSRSFPPVNVDEAFLSNHAYNLVKHHNNRYGLYDDLFDKNLYVWRDATAGLLQIVYEAWIGPFVAVLPKSLAHARASSLAAGFLTLVLLFLTGRRISGNGLGAWLVAATALQPFFVVAASITRAEMVLLLAGVGLFYLALEIPEHAVWKYGLLGLLSGVCLGIHQNSVPLFMGLWAFYGLRPSEQRLSYRLVWPPLCFLLGAAGIVRMINLTKFWVSQKYGFYELYKPPILAWPLMPWLWVKQWILLATTGRPSWYLRENNDVWWTASLTLYWVAMGLVLVSFLFKARKPGPEGGRHPLIKPVAGALGVLFLGMCVWIRKQEAIYTIIFVPWTALLTGLAMECLGNRRRWVATFAGLALVSSLAAFGRFTEHYRRLYMPYDQFLVESRRLIAPDAKLAAPCIFWFDRADALFRDSSALVGSYWLSGGRRDIGTWLAGWKPDILVVEPSWKHMLLGRGDTRDLLQKALPVPVEALGSIDMGPASEGTLEVFRLRWRDKN